MAKIKWTNLALDDLRNVYEYLAKDSPKYADRLLNKIVQRVDVLVQHPKIGRKVPEFDIDKIRELIEGNYRIIYRIESEDYIGIARIHHSAQPLKEI